jgi:tetratricopeptide (TPR) repeat protein
MMQHIFVIFIITILFSCNGDEKKIAPVSNTTINENDEIALKEAVLKNPDSANFMKNLIFYYLEKGNNDKALTTINNALLKDSSNAYLWDLKSIATAERGDTAGSIKALENAISILPLPEYIISLGNLYAMTGDIKALEMADALLAGDKAKAEKEAYYIKGLYYRYKNEQAKSIPFFDKAIVSDYNFMLAYLEKGLALYDLQKYSESASVFEQSIKVQNKFEQGYYYLGQCYEKLHLVKDAIEVYQMALQLDADYIEAKDALGKLGVK